MTHVTDLLHEVNPEVHSHGVTYDGIDWDAADDSRVVEDEDAFVVTGVFSYGEVDASGFKGLKTRLPVRSDTPTGYVTDQATYVLEKLVYDPETGTGEIHERKLADAMGRALGDLAEEGVVEGLRPVVERAPPRKALAEKSLYDDRIEAIHLEDDGDDFVPYVVPATDTTEEAARAAVRTVGGVRYPKPDNVAVVDDRSYFPDE